MSRSYRKPIYKDKGYMNDHYSKIVRKNEKNVVQKIFHQLRGTGWYWEEEDYWEDQINKPFGNLANWYSHSTVDDIPNRRGIVNDWDISDYTFDYRKERSYHGDKSYETHEEFLKDNEELKIKMSRK